MYFCLKFSIVNSGEYTLPKLRKLSATALAEDTNRSLSKTETRSQVCR